MLTSHGFTGEIEAKFAAQLGRPIDSKRAQLGRALWSDLIGGLHNDNTCAGCRPTNGFGDTQSIAIGIDNNLIVGPDRTGPRNQRRMPLAINTALYPSLMWNSRFTALSGDPFGLSRAHRGQGWGGAACPTLGRTRAAGQGLRGPARGDLGRASRGRLGGRPPVISSL